jgi:hypothetical protein
VRTVSRDQSGSLDKRLIVAGGGGGSGEGTNCGTGGPGLAGGTGGDAGSDSGNGTVCVDADPIHDIYGETTGGTGGEAGGQSAGSPASRQIGCEPTDPRDVLEETVTAGSSSLSYDATTERYTYVWKTNKGWANTCRELVVKLDDGTEHVADFKFVK